MGAYNNIGGIAGAGLAIGQQQKPQNAPTLTSAASEVECEMGELSASMEELGRCIFELDERLTPVLRQIPVADSTGNSSGACTSPLGCYLAGKTADMGHLTRRVQSILDRLAI